MAVASRLVTARGSVGRDDTWCISGWKSQRVDVSAGGCIRGCVHELRTTVCYRVRNSSTQINRQAYQPQCYGELRICFGGNSNFQENFHKSCNLQ